VAPTSPQGPAASLRAVGGKRPRPEARPERARSEEDGVLSQTPAATAAGSAAISRARSSSLMPPQTP
jgi:hypothetical protein